MRIAKREVRLRHDEGVLVELNDTTAVMLDAVMVQEGQRVLTILECELSLELVERILLVCMRHDLQCAHAHFREICLQQDGVAVGHASHECEELRIVVLAERGMDADAQLNDR